MIGTPYDVPMRFDGGFRFILAVAHVGSHIAYKFYYGSLSGWLGTK
jgi:hypothetical protein